MVLKRNPRKFVSEELKIDSWEKILPYFEDLVNRTIDDKEQLLVWLSDKSELEAILEEDMAWRYIQMTIDTSNQEFNDQYTFFIQEISPKVAPYDDLLNKKLMVSPGIKELSENSAFAIYFRGVEKSIDMFRKENIPLMTLIQEKSSNYGNISANQSIEWEGEKITMQKAANLLKKQDQSIREKAFRLITARRSEDTEVLENLFDELIQLRHRVATNAGYSNYRDYKFDELGRFDYKKEDCFDFHDSIKQYIVPLVQEIQEKHARKLGQSKIKPWDSDVDPDGLDALKPFEGGEELFEKTKKIFDHLDPYFGKCLQTMKEMKHLDLDAKNGKSPGGYNYPLHEIGVPFIFMNASGAQRDVVTMIHEGGHAIHSFLSRELALTSFKNVPSEVAELASMSMELLTMSHWDEFYKDEPNLNRAKKEQLEDILKVLPWIATIDAFQHWIYTHPTHSREERKTQWLRLQEEYGNGTIDWTGFENTRSFSWHRQLHLFEVPFYYIEYGIAQLGAIGIWKNALENKVSALEDYKKALALGYTKDLPSLYKAANLKFDFGNQNVQQLSDFMSSKLAEFS